MDDDQDRELLAVECEHWRTRAHAAEEEAKSLREGLRHLGYAMQDGDCHRIRDRWGGNTPEDWCGEADALQGILERLHVAERRAAVLAALLGCAGEITAETFADGGSHELAIGQLVLLANTPATLCENFEDLRPIIETALGAAGLTINDLEEQD